MNYLKTRDGIKVPRELLRPAFFFGEVGWWYLMREPRLLKDGEWTPLTGEDVKNLNDKVLEYREFEDEKDIEGFLLDSILTYRGRVETTGDYVLLDEDILLYSPEWREFVLPSQLMGDSVLLYPQLVIIYPRDLQEEEA